MEPAIALKEAFEAFFSDDNVWKYVAVILVIISASFILRAVFSKIIFGLARYLFPRYKDDIANFYLPAFRRPAGAFIFLLGLYFSLNYLPLSSGMDFLVLRCFRSGIIILLAWGFYNLTGGKVSILRSLDRTTNMGMDEVVLKFISKIIRFLIIAVTIAIVAREWGFDVNGFIAGLGLGGLAIALAAKDAIANIFGGLVIITDKPFSVGDWISTPSVEGVVEEVCFRSTRIRTFAHAVTTMPNSVLANEAIVNWSRIGKRRITFNLGVTYSTPATKLRKCVADIKLMLENHAGVHKETIFVRFDTFGDSSLEVFIYFFTVTTQWGDFLAVKEDVNFKIMEILEKEEVSVAFPSRSIYFENDLKKE